MVNIKKAFKVTKLKKLFIIQDCIDFCHKHNIIPKTRLITNKDLDRVYDELRGKNDAVLRF